MHNFATSIVHCKKTLGAGPPILGGAVPTKIQQFAQSIVQNFDLSERQRKMGGIL
jgi:hypothetical protein